MPRLIWDDPRDRTYETGIEKAVVYTQDGSAYVWNGLAAVSQKNSNSVTPIYFDGIKANDLVQIGDYSASVSAYTYPDIIEDMEGSRELNSGIYLSQQRPSTFSFTYQTRVYNAEDGEYSRRIHVIYNATISPSDRSMNSLGETMEPAAFEWSMTAVPESFPGFRPTSYMVLDTSRMDSRLLEELELRFYGDDITEARLPPQQELLTLIEVFLRVEIVDNKDGTWTARTNYPEYITMLSSDLFQLNDVNVVYLDADTYIISDTRV